LGFTPPPRVVLALGGRGEKGGGGGQGRSNSGAKNGKEEKWKQGGGKAFSASNPYGDKKSGDKRQFTK